MKYYSKFISVIIVYFMSILFLQSCGQMNKQSGGTLIGGVAGGLLGSRFGKGGGQVAATGLGALTGALVGGSIGKSMDETDRKMAALASRKALELSPSGTAIEWRNPDNGHRGSVTPTRTFRSEGRYCREYIQEAVINQEKQKIYGTACRQPDGSWQVLR